MRTRQMIDSPEGYEYVPAPEEIQTMMRCRFDDAGITAMGDLPGTFKHDIENTWDGPYTVYAVGDGVFAYTSPYTGETDRFNVDGFFSRFDGMHFSWDA